MRSLTYLDLPASLVFGDVDEVSDFLGLASLIELNRVEGDIRTVATLTGLTLLRLCWNNGIFGDISAVANRKKRNSLYLHKTALEYRGARGYPLSPA